MSPRTYKAYSVATLGVDIADPVTKLFVKRFDVFVG